METSSINKTPESRLSTKNRVLAVDPNGGRCLVENCSPNRSIEYCHLVPRNHWKDTSFLDSLEWHWKMRAHTLNLDTRRNTFPAGASVHRMHDAGRWILVPEDNIIQQYYDSLVSCGGGVIVGFREQFPIIQDRNDFKYHFVPLREMKDIAFSHQNATPPTLSPADFTIHVYPFNTLPVLISHVHPKFVIVAAGYQLSAFSTDAFNDLVNLFPNLAKIYALYRAWSAWIPANAKEDDSFWPPYNPADNNSSDNNDGDNHEDKNYDAVTEKGRYGWARKRAREESPTRDHPHTRPPNNPGGHWESSSDKVSISMSDSASNCGDDAVTEKGRYRPPGHRRRRPKQDQRSGPSQKRMHSSGGLSQPTVIEHTRKVGKMEWSPDELRDWSRQCQILAKEGAGGPQNK